MKCVGVFDAKNRLTALIDDVERGEGEVVITRRGKPVAKLVAVDGGLGSTRAAETVQRLRAASRGKTLGGIPLRALIEEGRR